MRPEHDAIPNSQDPECERNAHPSRCWVNFCLVAVCENVAKSDATKAMWREHGKNAVHNENVTQSIALLVSVGSNDFVL